MGGDALGLEGNHRLGGLYSFATFPYFDGDRKMLKKKCECALNLQVIVIK